MDGRDLKSWKLEANSSKQKTTNRKNKPKAYFYRAISAPPVMFA